MVFFYLQNKQKNIFIILAGPVIVYSAIFFVIATPYVLKLFSEILRMDFPLVSNIAIKYLLLIIFPLGVGISFFANKKVFVAIAKDLRWLRLLHFELMLILGVALVVKKFSALLVTNYIFLSISILFFWLFSVMTNNIADQDIDIISNPNRPLIEKKVDLMQYKIIAYTVLFCGLVYALAVNASSFLIISGVVFSYYIYSMPPLRLKRIPVFSKAIISLVSLAIVLLGYINLQGSWQGFPKFFVWFFLVGFTLPANFIDIKDYAGDKANGIMTIPVLLTPILAKFFIGVFFVLTNLALYFYFHNLYLLPLLLAAGGLEFYFVNQKNYREWIVFGAYLITIIMLIVYMRIPVKSINDSGPNRSVIPIQIDR